MFACARLDTVGMDEHALVGAFTIATDSYKKMTKGQTKIKESSV